MKFIELFAGIGAFRLGLEKAGHECVWSNEWNKNARGIYERRFGEQPDPRDISTVEAADIPDADIICGGFPCATFSLAGKKTGLSVDDTRGTLAFEMFRLARDKKIPYILFENVKGLLGNDKGRSFRIILSVLDGMGYDTQWQVLNSKDFGVPQHRERIFLVANSRDKPRPKVFPIIGKIHVDDGGSEKSFEQSEEGFKLVRPVLTPQRLKRRQRGRRMKENNDPSFTLTAQDIHGVYINHNNSESIRRLTPLEYERLQGLPDEYTKFYSNGSLVSDVIRYERCGRAVTIPIIKEIGIRLNEFY